MSLPYAYIINDIAYQCCAYSYSFVKYIENFRHEKTNVKFYVRFFARFRSFIVSKQTECYVFINYFLRMEYKRVPFSSVVTSSKLGSTAFTKASNHVW